MEYLDPWYAVDDPSEQRGLENQLARETGPAHVLRGAKASLLARRADNDDALFQLADGRVAWVHLTWRKGPEPDPRWPMTSIHDSLDQWAEVVMKPDAAEWDEGRAERRSAQTGSGLDPADYELALQRSGGP